MSTASCPTWLAMLCYAMGAGQAAYALYIHNTYVHTVHIAARLHIQTRVTISTFFSDIGQIFTSTGTCIVTSTSTCICSVTNPSTRVYV